MSVSGDIREMKISHPTLGNRNFRVKSDESTTFDLGGFRNEDDANQISTDGIPHYKKNLIAGSLEIVVYIDTSATDDLTFLNSLAGANESATLNVSLADNSVYGGTGLPAGDMQTDTNAGTMTLKFRGGIWKKLA